MGGGGSIMQSIKTQRYNRSLLRKKRLFKSGRSYFQAKQAYVRAAGGELAFKTASSQQLAAIRQKMQKERRRERVYMIRIAILICAFAGWMIVKLLPSEPQNITNFHSNPVTKADMVDYDYFLLEGDKWMAKGQWYNALFEYDKAYDFVIKDYTAHSQKGLKQQYQLEFENVKNADVLDKINGLISRFPNRIELYRFRARYFSKTNMPELAKADLKKINELMESQ